MKVQAFIMFALQLCSIFNSKDTGKEKEKIVKAQYKLFLDSYYMFSQHGSPYNNFYLSLDLTSPLTRISKISYGYQRSRTNSFIQNTTVQLKKGLILIGAEYEDQLEINHTKIPKLSYIVTEMNDKDFAKNNLYAMAYKISNTNHSITHQLKNYGLIDQLSFSFTKMANETGSIYFGDIPKEIVKGLYNTSIKVRGKKDDNWDCSLSYAFIRRLSYVNTNTYLNRYPAYFTTKVQKIQVPTAFYYFVIKMFKRPFSNQQCKYSGEFEIECDCREISLFPSINFIIEDKLFRLKNKDYFKQVNTKCKFMITKNTRGNEWIFGTQFIAKYHSTFNYEKKNIVFYSSENWEIVDLDILFPEKRIYKMTVILIFILLLGLFWRCILLMWKKQPHKYDPNTTSKPKTQLKHKQSQTDSLFSINS